MQCRCVISTACPNVSADGVGALGDETSSAAVRRIVQPGRDFPDTSPGLGGDQIRTRECSGRRRDGNFGDTCNILDRHSQIGISGFSGLNRLGNTRIPEMDRPTNFFGAAHRLSNILTQCKRLQSAPIAQGGGIRPAVLRQLDGGASENPWQGRRSWPWLVL